MGHRPTYRILTPYRISVSKTKILASEEQTTDQWINGQRTIHSSITLQGQALEEIESFSYLGNEVGQSVKVEKKVTVRLEKAGKVYQM